jgi:predicted RNase H-like nuclease (RuvC/YqgF family)
MSQTSRFLLQFVAVIFSLAAVGYSQDTQSLGDVARQTRQQKQVKNVPGKDGQTRKVVTNEEIPEHPSSTVEESAYQSHESVSSNPPSGAGKVSAEQWKTQIQGQKNVVSSLQKQIDKLNSSIHFVEANLYVNGVQYNKRQAEKQQEVERAQAQLEEQKKRLEDLQESARKQGYGSSVYDP